MFETDRVIKTNFREINQFKNLISTSPKIIIQKWWPGDLFSGCRPVSCKEPSRNPCR